MEKNIKCQHKADLKITEKEHVLKGKNRHTEGQGFESTWPQTSNPGRSGRESVVLSHFMDYPAVDLWTGHSGLVIWAMSCRQLW